MRRLELGREWTDRFRLVARHSGQSASSIACELVLRPLVGVGSGRLDLSPNLSHVERVPAPMKLFDLHPLRSSTIRLSHLGKLGAHTSRNWSPSLL